MKFIPLIARNLMRNRRRTILTVISIAVSLFIFSTLMSLPGAANQALKASQSSKRATTYNKAGQSYSLPEAYREEIERAPHVEAVSALTWFGGIYDDPKNQFPNIAVDPEHIDQVWSDWGLSAEGVAEFKRLRIACIVGTDTMNRFGWHVGQQIMLRGTIYPVTITLQIVGTLGDKAPPSYMAFRNYLVFRRDYLREVLGGRGGSVTMFWFAVDRPESIPAVVAHIDETFANSANQTHSESETTNTGNFLGAYRLMFTIAEILGCMVVIAIALVAANTAAMSIRERRSEVAILRALGFSSRLVLFCLVSECLLIGMIGGAIGCLGGFAALKTFGIGLGTMSAFSALKMPLTVIAQGLLVAAAIGIASGYIPARSAARRNIVDALRSL